MIKSQALKAVVLVGVLALAASTLHADAWSSSGDGKRVESPLAFVQEGKQALVVSCDALGEKPAVVTAEIVLTDPGAAFQVHFSEPRRPGAKGKPAPDPAAPPALADAPRVTLNKDGQSVQIGRSPVALASPAPAPIPVVVAIDRRSVQALMGTYEEMRERSEGQPVSLHFTLIGGAKVQNLRVTPSHDGPLMPVATIGRRANVSIAGPRADLAAIDPATLPRSVSSINGIPFYFAEGDKIALDVSASVRGWKDPYPNTTFYHERSLEQFGRVWVSVPGDQYSAVHLIAFSAGRPDHVQRMTVRVGLYGNRLNIMEDVIVEVPALSTAKANGELPPVPVKLVDGREGYLHHLRVPLAKTANVKEFRRFTLEFTRDLRTHQVPPDPSYYGKLPLGLPSDVVVLAATLEPAAVTMTHRSDEGGNVFHDTQKVKFTLTLNNRSSRPADIRAYAIASGPGTGQELGIEPRSWTVEQNVRLDAGQSKDVELDVTPPKRGWYSCQIGIESAGIVLQQRDTTFAVLAPDTRKAVEDSPFGVWEFWFPHSVAKNPNQVEVLASLIHKGGWRWTYGGSPVQKGQNEDSAEVFKRLKEQYKITWTVNNLPHGYQRGAGWWNEAEFAEQDAKLLRSKLAGGVLDPHFKVLHESRSSPALVRRFSEYLGGEPYNMPAAEKEKLEKQFENVKKYTAAIKAVDPRAKIVLVNDYPAVANEYMARGLPAENFDVIGLEGAMFLRAPERQPDWMSLLGQIHQTRRMLKKHGYDKPIWTTEALYHPTEAGGLSLHEQGVISVREAMMALQLGVARMAAAGLIKDASDDYHWSNWGSAGFCYRDPEINPKPSYAMYAWLTQVLDQAKPAGNLATPNSALHVVDFQKPDGSHVYGVWTARGVQTVVLKSTGKATVHDVYGNGVSAAEEDITLSASPTPQYVTGTTLEAVVSATPIEQKGEIGKVLVEFDRPDQLKAASANHPVLDKTWETPRLKGNFDSAFTTEDGASALKITLKPDEDARKLLPRYVTYDLAQPIALDDHAWDFAVRVKGNTGWGRIMFEVVDAKGRVFTSSGNQYAGATNSADSLGDSFINFEGWQTIRFPIVGMYPGGDQSAYRPGNYNWWPTNSPEELEIGPKAEAARETYEDQMEEHSKALEAWETANEKWQAAAEAAKAAGKPSPKQPAKPVAPRLRPVVYQGQVPVSYPIKLTKLIVDMRPSILYLNEEKPVANPTIYIDQLGVTHSSSRQ